MATTTTNYAFSKPAATDATGVRTDYNTFLDAADTAIKGVADGVKANAGAMKFVSGRYYTAPHISTTDAPGANTLNLTALRVPNAVTLDRLAVQVTTGAALATVRLGIYTPDANGFPATRLLDAGTVDGTGAAVVEATISQAVSAGIIWLAVVNQGANPTLRAMNYGDPLIHVTTAALALSSSPVNGYYQSGVSGALPATLTLTGVNSTCPLVAVRVA